MGVGDSVALVTGASSGIGRAIALRLAAQGTDVVVHGRDPGRTAEVARLTGGSAVCADLARPGAGRSLAHRVLAGHERVDLLVASAGAGWSGPFPGMSPDTLAQMVATDLAAPLELVHALLPGMLARRRGRIVLVGSVAGRTGVAGEAVYAACKAGLDAFAESLRLELAGTGVGVTVVVPAAVSTPFFERRGRPYERRVPRPVPADRVARATIAAIRRGRAEVWVPAWPALGARARALFPRGYRRLALRYGEPVRATDRPDGSVRDERRDE